MMRVPAKQIVGLLLVAALAGCAASRPAHGPGADGSMAIERIAEALVVEVWERRSHGSETLADDRAGALFGGYAGFVIGSFIGDGAGRAAAKGLGFLTGLFVGAIAENEAKRRTVTEYGLRLEDGTRITVIEPGSPVAAAGERVEVRFYSGGGAELAALPDA